MVQQCAGCQLPIADKFLLKVLDRVWHANCVQCNDCKCALTERCFSREGKLFCRNDFYRRYGTKCAGCDQGISPNDMVRRAKHLVFHVECFVCSYCKRQIATGDELYYIGEGSFICKEDYYQSHHNNIDESVEDPKDLSYGLDEDLDAALASKRRGPRTTIKAKQLEALKSTFAATPKPSRNIREKLAQETGLNMRVIQVWFQNRRSKERRLKQSGGQTSAPRPARSSRRSRISRLSSSEASNENQPELQNVNSSHLNYHQQDLQTPPGHYGAPNFNEFYSQNSPIAEGIVLNNSSMVHGTSYGRQHISGGSIPNSDITEGSGLSNSVMTGNVNLPVQSPNGGGVFNAAGQPQSSIVNPAPSDVW